MPRSGGLKGPGLLNRPTDPGLPDGPTELGLPDDPKEGDPKGQKRCRRFGSPRNRVRLPGRRPQENLRACHKYLLGKASNAQTSKTRTKMLPKRDKLYMYSHTFA